MRILGFAIVRTDRLREAYQHGIQRGRREGHKDAVSTLRRPVATGDLVTVKEVLEKFERRPAANPDGATGFGCSGLAAVPGSDIYRAPFESGSWQ